MSTKTLSLRFALPAVALLGSASLLLSGCTSTMSAPKETPEQGTGAGASQTFSPELHDSLPDSIKSSGTLKVALVLTDELFSYEKEGEVSGVVVDLAHAAGEILGVEVEFVDTPFPGMIPALQAQRVDVIWTTMNDTVEREEVLDFTDWIRTSNTLLIKQDNPEDIGSFEDLCGLRAGTIRGAAPVVAMLEEENAKCLAAGEPAIDMKLYDDFVSGQTQMRSGQMDAFVGPASKLKYIIKLDGAKSGLAIIDETRLGGVLGIAVSKDKPELTDALLESLKILSENGTYMSILEVRGIEGEGLTTDEFQINGIGAGAFE